MNLKTGIAIACVGVLVVSVVCLVVSYRPIEKSTESVPVSEPTEADRAQNSFASEAAFSGSEDTSHPEGEQEPALAQEGPVTLTVVVPTYELEELIEGFEVIFEEAEEQTNYAVARMEWLALKKKGHTRWGSEHWMKDPNYYQRLETRELVEECFSRTIFANEMILYSKPQFGLDSLKIFHNGFAELFKREDLWEGILHLYEHLSAKLDPEADLLQIVTAAQQLDLLRTLYVLSPLREQVKGREAIFLDANLRVLKRFQWYLEHYDPEKLGTGGSAGFFREPCSVAQVGLMLAKQVDPKRYAEIEPVVTSVRWPEQQRVQDLESFISLVVKGLEGVVPGEQSVR
jgi:hypothetical protein